MRIPFDIELRVEEEMLSKFRAEFPAAIVLKENEMRMQIDNAEMIYSVYSVPETERDRFRRMLHDFERYVRSEYDVVLFVSIQSEPPPAEVPWWRELLTETQHLPRIAEARAKYGTKEPSHGPL